MSHAPRLPVLDRETAVKVWPWRMWIGVALTENLDRVRIMPLGARAGVVTVRDGAVDRATLFQLLVCACLCAMGAASDAVSPVMIRRICGLSFVWC